MASNSFFSNKGPHLFSSPELKAQVSFSDHLSSVVCPSVRPSVRPSVCLSVCLCVCLSVCKLFTFSSFFSRTTVHILTKLGTEYPRVKEIQVCSKEGPHASQKGDNQEIIEINLQLLKIFFSRTNRPITTKLCTQYPWLKEIHVCSNEGPRPFPRGDNYEIVKIH